MRKWSLIGILLMLLQAFGGCSNGEAIQTEQTVLASVILDHGHGSMWGCQFYVNINAEQIVETSYFPAENSNGDQVSRNNIPIAQEQWEQVEAAVMAVKPQLQQVKQPGWWERILRSTGSQKLDGGEFRYLTLTWQSGEETQEVVYEWLGSEEAAELERLLEELVDSLHETYEE